MKFWAATDKQSLVTVYLGIHEDEKEAWHMFLGWPSDDEVREAKLKFVLEQVAIYPVAQACRPCARRSTAAVREGT